MPPHIGLYWAAHMVYRVNEMKQTGAELDQLRLWWVGVTAVCDIKANLLNGTELWNRMCCIVNSVK